LPSCSQAESRRELGCWESEQDPEKSEGRRATSVNIINIIDIIIVIIIVIIITTVLIIITIIIIITVAIDGFQRLPHAASGRTLCGGESSGDQQCMLACVCVCVCVCLC
jgi:uncharacterized membrane protein